MLRRMSSAELTEWLAFASLEPFGGDADYIGAAIISSTVYNVQRGKRKAMKPIDFIPQFSKRKQSTEEQVQFAQMLAAAGLGVLGDGE